MGCCMSTQNEQHCRDAPTTPPEEETVKEVLLETHVLPKAAITNDTEKEKMEAALEAETENQELLKAASFEPSSALEIKNASLEKPSEKDKEIEMSSSFTESLSCATDKNESEDLVEVNQKLPSARKKHCDHQVARKIASPRRRLTPRSPEKKGMAVPAKRSLETEKDIRRERGVSSGKVLNGGKVADHQNLSENDNKKAAAAAAAGVNGRMMEEDDLEAETLENPVVSFECFIFL